MPVDQLPRIDAQLAQSPEVVAKYSALGNGNLGDDKELDQFMTHFVLLLCLFKEQLQQHVRVHAMEAVMACWEIEQSFQSLIAGVSPEKALWKFVDEELITNAPFSSSTSRLWFCRRARVMERK